MLTSHNIACENNIKSQNLKYRIQHLWRVRCQAWAYPGMPERQTNEFFYELMTSGPLAPNASTPMATVGLTQNPGYGPDYGARNSNLL